MPTSRFVADSGFYSTERASVEKLKCHVGKYPMDSFSSTIITSLKEEKTL